MTDVAVFDYVIVGAGSAGCALAVRLSENPSVTVLLLEAGGADGTPLFTVPGAQVFVKNWPRYAWLYDCEPDASRHGVADNWRRGRILGGSSTINGLIWAVGLPSDYDAWSAAGLHDWSWSSVAPYFHRSETYADASPAERGRSGPVHVERFRSPHALTADLIAACAGNGMAAVEDINGINGPAVGFAQTNQRRGLRQSSSAAYLAPVRRRANLTVWTHAKADRLLFDGRRAMGVELRREGVTVQARARSEVLVCAGAIASPQLLMRSGIGPAEHLQALGLPVLVDSPQVGRNLQEHPELYVEFEVTTPTYTRSSTWAGMLAAGARYAWSRSGPATSPGTHLLGYAHSGQQTGGPPDLLLFAGPWGRLEDEQTFSRGTPVFSLSPSVARPRSRGMLCLSGAHPDAPPRIEPNLLSDPDDVATLAAGVRLVDRIAATAPFARHVSRRLTPDFNLDDTAALHRFIRDDASICYHASGTCRMGIDSSSVVDQQLRVRGIEALRVVDASVMPTIPSGNLNAPTIMISERAADFIRGAN